MWALETIVSHNTRTIYYRCECFVNRELCMMMNINLLVVRYNKAPSLFFFLPINLSLNECVWMNVKTR